MKKILMAAAAFCCMTMTVTMTSCTSDIEDNPSIPAELQLTLAPDAVTDVAPINDFIDFRCFNFALNFIANTTEEISTGDFSFEVDDESIETAGLYGIPGEDQNTKLLLDQVHFTGGFWWAVFTCYYPSNAVRMAAVVKVMFRGKQVAIVNIKYEKPYEIQIKTLDGYLYPGETYTATLFDYGTGNSYDGFWLLSPVSLYADGVDTHSNDYEGEDHTIVIPEDFPFNDAEKEQGFATIALGGLAEDGEEIITFFRVKYQEN